jgi:predicted nucleotidyltransferase
MIFPVYPDAAACEALRSPLRLGMDDYASFVAELLAHADPAKVARQKEAEERIALPFRLLPEMDLLQTVADTLAKELGLKVAIVYGSAATGKMRRDSDVDVAVLCDQPLDVDARLALWGKLTYALHREVDLVDLFDLGGEILHQILTKGRVVLKKDEAAYYELAKRMVYDREDFMGLVRRAQRERIGRMLYG